MQNTTLSLLVMLACLCSANADVIQLGNHYEDYGKVWFITDSATVNATASWSGEDACPFDMKKIVAAAKHYANERLSPPKTPLRVDYITMERISNRSKNLEHYEKWCFVVRFRRITADGSSGAYAGNIYILSDGTLPKTELKSRWDLN